MHKSIGVILAGGRGARFGASVPKQFIKLAGKLVIEHTVETFQKSPDIDELVIVSTGDFIEFVWELVEKNHWTKVTKVVQGGDERFDSTHSAITALSDHDDDANVFFHDAARPLITHEIIKKCKTALEVFKAVDVVIPSSDTIVQINDNGCISSIPMRASLRRGQTPQAFKLGTIRAAYNNAVRSGKKTFTCDCGVVRAMLPGVEVVTVDGAESNLKITNATDLFLAEKLIQTNSLNLIDSDAEIAGLKGQVIVIFGGSYGIGRSIGDLCLQHGAKVYSASRSENNIDVKDKESVEGFLKQVHATEGHINHVVNTAGILIKKPLTTMTSEEINKIIDVNLKGAINVAYSAKEYLRESRGCLLNFTSSSYTRGRAFYALYSATKAGVVNLTQALSDEWHGDSIRVNCINPERTDTPMRRENFGIEPAGSLLSPTVVARMSVLSLLSNYTGLIIDVRNL